MIGLLTAIVTIEIQWQVFQICYYAQEGFFRGKNNIPHFHGSY